VERNQIVPGASNNVAIDLIVTHIRKQLDARSLRFRNKLTYYVPSSDDALPDGPHGDNGKYPDNAILVPQTRQVRVSVLRLKRE
jgi:uridine kinase